MKMPDIETEAGRAGWAFLAILGGCIIMTLFAAVGVYLVRDSQHLSFWLALAAHGQIFVGLSAMGWVLGRRITSQINDKGFTLDDKE